MSVTALISIPPQAQAYAPAGGEHVSHRLDDLSIYSTTLWHLGNENELSYLAHELVQFDRRCGVAPTLKIGRQLMPLFIDFQMPPPAAAT